MTEGKRPRASAFPTSSAVSRRSASMPVSRSAARTIVRNVQARETTKTVGIVLQRIASYQPANAASFAALAAQAERDANGRYARLPRQTLLEFAELACRSNRRGMHSEWAL